jgi:hypothetical protein
MLQQQHLMKVNISALQKFCAHLIKEPVAFIYHLSVKQQEKMKFHPKKATIYNTLNVR